MRSRLAFLFVLLSLLAPAKADPETFRAFGGIPGLTRVVDVFMVELLADPRTRPFFESVDQENLKRLLVEQFCAELQGGCTYTGRGMREAHQGLQISHADFNALVEALQRAMAREGVPFRAQNKLLAKLAPMHREIIGQ
jgi:hemoglobin